METEHKIDFDIVDNKIIVNCPNCKHSFQLGHLEWSAILCPQCKCVLRQEDEEEEELVVKKEVVELPVVIIAKKQEEKMVVMTPTDALLYLNGDYCEDEDIHWIHEGTLECTMQKLVDMLICHPEFFHCLDVAIDSDPRDRRINRLLMKAKKQPEN